MWVHGEDKLSSMKIISGSVCKMFIISYSKRKLRVIDDTWKTVEQQQLTEHMIASNNLTIKDYASVICLQIC